MTKTVEHDPEEYGLAFADPETAEHASAYGVEATEAAARIRDYKRSVAVGIIAIGQDLLLVKAKLPHGLFLEWVEVECGFTARTAQSFLSVAREFGAKTEIAALLPPTALYALAAKSTPQDARDRILSRIEEGEQLSIREIKAELKKAREHQQNLKKKGRGDDDGGSGNGRKAREQERLEQQQKAAEEAAQFLTDRLGEDWPKFVTLVEAAGPAFEKVLLRATPETAT